MSTSFIPGPEAEELRTVVRGFLARHCDEPAVRHWMQTEPGYDPDIWRRMAREPGLPGLAIAERWGGSGATAVELGVVFEELGRALYGGPFLGTVALAASVLSALDDPAAQQRHLPGIAAGHTTGALAWGGADPLTSTLRAERDSAGGWRITGRAGPTVDGGVATLLLAVADTPEGLGVFAVEPGADGLARTALTPLDSTRGLAELDFAAAPATAVGTPGAVTERLSSALDVAVVLLACEQVGGASRTLEMAVEHAGTRVQFGRRIGSFQAVKHRCADMLVAVESARSAAYFGTWAAAHDHAELPLAAALAGAVCSEAYTRCALDNIQLHGGIGFTWEHPAHLYAKRARSSQLLLGSPVRHRSRLGRILDIPEARPA